MDFYINNAAKALIYIDFYESAAKLLDKILILLLGLMGKGRLVKTNK